jgi:hypothetical protein
MIYLKYNYINNYYNFNIKLNYNFKTLKTKQMLYLLWYMLMWLHPHPPPPFYCIIYIWTFLDQISFDKSFYPIS